MGNTSINWDGFSDGHIIEKVGGFIRHQRIQQSKTQSQLAETAGLNRWTISQIEKGESITLSSLIQILRALGSLHILSDFEVSDEISPLEYAKLKKKQRKRVRPKNDQSTDKSDSKW